jgi:hypothetical protein
MPRIKSRPGAKTRMAPRMPVAGRAPTEPGRAPAASGASLKGLKTVRIYRIYTFFSRRISRCALCTPPPARRFSCAFPV